MHSYSTQSKQSIYRVIYQARDVFALTEVQAEKLANSAGLSLEYKGGGLVEALGYKGKRTELCACAMVSERMLRLYKYKTPPKQTLLALAMALCKNYAETDTLLHTYGYCLSDSIVGDLVVKWFLTESENCKSEHLIFRINEILLKMELPLLMTRQL